MMNASARLAARLTVAATFAVTGTACLAADLSEADFLDDLPTVLSVSRLAQPLNETPGAVTVLDREMIRLSGARELVDLLRMVPGFVVGHINGANPVANYHGDDSLSRRLQVFVDGRSVYSTLLFGNVSHPMMGLVLDDIERVEVLRGSNSAAYGANAYSGVVNIVTRNAADVPRATANVALGEDGIFDRGARVALGDPGFAVRVTASKSGDTGFDNVLDDKRVEQLHVRGDLRPSLADDVTFSVGAIKHLWQPTTDANINAWRNLYAQANWQHRVDEDRQFSLNASFDEEKFINQYFFGVLRADGTGRRFSLEGQYSTRLTPAQRIVWGGQLRREEIQSQDMFSTARAQAVDTRRLFGHIEWRLAPSWVLNAGGLWEDHPILGQQAAPRLGVNHHVAPGHTVRLGGTRAFRMPTLYELRGLVSHPLLPVPWLAAKGNVRPERLDSREIGYLGELRSLGLTLDFRGFRESVSSVAVYDGAPTRDIINKSPYRRTGWEIQARWQPRAETRIIANLAAIRIASQAAPNEKYGFEHAAPRSSGSLQWFESLPWDFQFALMGYWSGAMTWTDENDVLAPMRRVDVHLSRRFRVGASRIDLGVTVQAATGGYQDVDPARYFPRRAFATLKLEF